MCDAEKRKKAVTLQKGEYNLLARLRQLRRKGQCQYVLVRLDKLELHTIGNAEKCERDCAT